MYSVYLTVRSAENGRALGANALLGVIRDSETLLLHSTAARRLGVPVLRLRARGADEIRGDLYTVLTILRAKGMAWSIEMTANTERCLPFATGFGKGVEALVHEGQRAVVAALRAGKVT